MTIEVKFAWRGGRVMQQLNTAAQTGLRKSGKIILDEMRRLILDEAKTGKMYGSHQASAPGEAPANETGELVESFTAEVDTSIKDKPTLIIGARADHATFLEYGTKFMAPRPFMRPAINNVQRRVEMAIALEIQKALNKK